MLSLCSTVHEAGPLNERTNLKNYRSVSNLSFVPKITEKRKKKKRKKKRFFLSSLNISANKLSYSGFQSAHLLGHSTRTAFLKIVNDFLLFFCDGNVSLLHLWDLPAAFDTIDIVHITP